MNRRSDGPAFESVTLAVASVEVVTVIGFCGIVAVGAASVVVVAWLESADWLRLSSETLSAK